MCHWLRGTCYWLKSLESAAQYLCRSARCPALGLAGGRILGHGLVCGRVCLVVFYFDLEHPVG